MRICGQLLSPSITVGPVPMVKGMHVFTRKKRTYNALIRGCAQAIVDRGSRNNLSQQSSRRRARSSVRAFEFTGTSSRHGARLCDQARGGCCTAGRGIQPAARVDLCRLTASAAAARRLFVAMRRTS